MAYVKIINEQTIKAINTWIYLNISSVRASCLVPLSWMAETVESVPNYNND
jgi:hypothetical protein